MASINSHVKCHSGAVIDTLTEVHQNEITRDIAARYPWDKRAWATNANACQQLIETETNGRQYPDDILKCISLNENMQISILSGPINNIPALV